jgi:hypothetical protein
MQLHCVHADVLCRNAQCGLRIGPQGYHLFSGDSCSCIVCMQTYSAQTHNADCGLALRGSTCLVAVHATALCACRRTLSKLFMCMCCTTVGDGCGEADSCLALKACCASTLVMRGLSSWANSMICVCMGHVV